jgi:uncharacterized delta-60 repeat protein
MGDESFGQFLKRTAETPAGLQPYLGKELGPPMRPIDPVGKKADPGWFWFKEEYVYDPQAGSGIWRIPGVNLDPETHRDIHWHPTLKYQAELRRLSRLRVVLPLGDECYFDLGKLFPQDTWENLVDPAGNDIPLRIWVHGGKVAGAWRTDIAGSPAEPPPPPSPAVGSSQTNTSEKRAAPDSGPRLTEGQRALLALAQERADIRKSRASSDVDSPAEPPPPPSPASGSSQTTTSEERAAPDNETDPAAPQDPDLAWPPGRRVTARQLAELAPNLTDRERDMVAMMKDPEQQRLQAMQMQRQKESFIAKMVTNMAQMRVDMRKAVAQNMRAGNIDYASLSLDTTFSDVGAAFASFRGESSIARALCVQPDGCLLAAGSVAAANRPEWMAVARFLPDGALDPEFGVDGWAIVDVPGCATVANAVAVQTDGRIVLAGQALDFESGSKDFAIVRLTKDGTVDTSFGQGGVVLTDFLGGTDDGAFAVSIQSNGRIVAAGYTTEPENLPSPSKARKRRSKAQTDAVARAEYVALARYTKTGRLDRTFGEGGVSITPLDGDRACAYGLAVQATGKLIAAGFARSSPAEGSNFVCLRYHGNGRPDRTFGHNGVATVDLDMNEEVARAVALQDDDKIVLAGSNTDQASNESCVALVRFDARGRLDRGFTSRAAHVPTLIAGAANSVVIQSDGAILAAGYATVDGSDKFALFRYDEDGSPDTAFGVDGVKLVDMGGLIDRAQAIAIDSLARIVLAGTSRTSKTDAFGLARLTPSWVD